MVSNELTYFLYKVQSQFEENGEAIITFLYNVNFITLQRANYNIGISDRQKYTFQTH